MRIWIVVPYNLNSMRSRLALDRSIVSSSANWCVPLYNTWDLGKIARDRD
ncbi:MAG: hypothetical protein SWY16_02380 [Cyanobacteriota bacterium]|nr:hypothetical protein [Cyanobacteriota bacterium]